MKKDSWNASKREGPKSGFLTVRCGSCSNEQVIFSKPSSSVKCLVCGSILADPTGGNAGMRAKVIHVMD